MTENFNHNFAEVNGVRLHYVREGTGNRLVVLLHGWPEFWYSWRHQLAALKSSYTVIAPDLRGFNESAKPKGVKNYEQAVVARDIVDLIRSLGYNKAVIAGHDWGGAIAWHLALSYPELVERLIILNCPHPSIFIENIKSNPMQLWRSWYMFFFQLPLIPEWAIGADLKRFFTKAFRDWACNKDNFPDDVIEEYVKAYKKEGALTGGINYYRANISAVRARGAGAGRKVQAPTLMIWGENDQALGKELTEGTEKFIDNTFRVHFIPKCSHWVQNDFPEVVNRAILEFLAEPKSDDPQSVR